MQKFHRPLVGSIRSLRGNGSIKTEERPVSNFKDVEVGGAAKVRVSQGDKSSVKIEADEQEPRQAGDRHTPCTAFAT